MPELSVVIPAFNEEKRLPSTLDSLRLTLEKLSDLDAEVIISNDGSKDKTSEVARGYTETIKQLRLIELSENQGKGAAIKAGLLEARGEWILIADADGSTPWKHLKDFLAFVETNPGTDVLIATRAHPDSEINTPQVWWRSAMGRCFNLIIRTLTGLKFKDTQCGFKLLNKKTRDACAADLVIKRFAWDVELLMRAQKAGGHIEECPVEWNHKDESRVHPVQDSLEMLWSVLKLRLSGKI